MKSLSIVPIACFLLFSATCLQAVEPLRQFGFAKIDITPTDSLRLSGYGSRDKPSEGIDERLFTRAMALRETDGSTHLLVAIDTIGVSGVMTKQLQEKIEKKHEKKTTVLRLEIDEIASGLSFMPEGLEKDLTLQDLADLLTFVQGESQQRETPP